MLAKSNVFATFILTVALEIFVIGIYSYMCGFTNGLCLWSQMHNDDFDWTLNKGETSSLNTGPAGDHTPGDGNGNYLYIESSDPRLPFDKAKLISPELLGPVKMQDGCNVSFILFFMKGEYSSL